MSDDVKTFPLQVETNRSGSGTVPVVVAMRAYDVYCALYGPQEALVTGWCRGGFGAGELIGFLYAHSFPREEWCMRFNEAITGLNLRGER